MNTDKEKGLIKNITEHHYRIPKYQRGYRWTTQEVSMLLEDIYEGILPFSDDIKKKINDSTDDTEVHSYLPPITSCYCIQPLVVVKKQEDEKIYYHVIDGQQRLTTIAIILAAIKHFLSSGAKGFRIKLSYDTRKNSADYLDTLYHDPNEAEKQKNKNIDYAHMWEAYCTAEKFFIQAMEGITEYREQVSGYLRGILLKNTRFIWYEPDISNSSEQEVFARFNTGKIELTNSELIKAVFMDPARINSSNVKDAQIVISEIWDGIENRLHEEELWAFIPHEDQYGQNAEDYSTRIESLFWLFTMKKKINVNNYSSFGLYYAVSEWIDNELNHNRILKDCWSEMTLVFHELLDLYECKDNSIYNLVGLYIHLMKDESVKTRYTELLKILGKPRNERKTELCTLIFNKLFPNTPATAKVLESKLKAIRYDNDSTNFITDIMLTYNIALLCKTSVNNSRYSFVNHNAQKWEREHIFATNVNPDRKNQNGHDFDSEVIRRNALEQLRSNDQQDNSYRRYLKYLYGDDVFNFIYLNNPSLAPKEAEKIFYDNISGSSSGRTLMLANALRAEHQADKLYEYYECIGYIDQITTEQDTEIKTIFAKRYFEKFPENKELIRIEDDSAFADRLEQVRSNILSQKKDYTFDLEEKYGWKYTPDTLDPEVLDKNVHESFRTYRNKLLEQFLNDKLTDTEMKYIYSMLELSKITIQKAIDAFFKKSKEESGSFNRLLSDNTLGNMCLLTKGDNISVGNYPFYAKRELINAFYSEGKYVPSGTAMVFSGNYSNSETADHYWLPESRLTYLQNVVKELTNLFQLK